MIKDQILLALQRASTKIKYSDSRLVQSFKKAGIGVVDKVALSEISLEFPKNEIFGDYTTNFAMVDFRKFAKNVDSRVGEIIWTNLPHFLKKIMNLQKLLTRLRLQVLDL
jgi:arginyl-tRNA synthetase